MSSVLQAAQEVSPDQLYLQLVRINKQVKFSDKLDQTHQKVQLETPLEKTSETSNLFVWLSGKSGAQQKTPTGSLLFKR